MIDTLLENSVLYEDSSSGALQLHTEFLTDVDNRNQELDGMQETELQQEVTAVVDDSAHTEGIVETAKKDTEFLPQYLTLQEYLGSPSHDDTVAVLCALEQFYQESLPTGGIPEPFLPVRGARLEGLTSLYSSSIVYVWLEDCDPCELVKADFEALLDPPPESIALFAVYGPDCASLLHDTFAVDGGPTTLFMHHDRVETRLQGAVPRAVLESEIEKLLEQTPSVD